ncbi:two-component system osmolarity sensor histidine kinase EnvZ [Azomonas agilis]|uniref:histidine kinase n=1 Tax=Azomonas agilis TaxID=116849 RepID=A0A562IYL3_9GAMM|nr:ATP-binding protein [Azomonas agilis]TWH76131.1 two-component system osmolarity sensor histidine kinase EnvZ [Azomonas agilis]
MTPPRWLPHSFFARTLWLVLAVVLFSEVLTLVYLLMHEDVLVDRQYSHGTALALRSYWAVDEDKRQKIAEASGMRTLSEEAVPTGEYHWPYSGIFSRQLRYELGLDTEVRVRTQPTPALWVKSPRFSEDWVEIPLYPFPLRGQRIWSVLSWFLGIGLLSTAAAWIFVSQLNQPLRHLVAAARQIGQGRSARVPISETPSEMTEVYRTFNQMAENVEQAGRERELMLAGVSHDLRTPLTRLRLSLELMNSDAELTEDMIRDVEDMNAILDQFLAFVRDGRDEPVETLQLEDLIKEVVAPYNQHQIQINLALEEIPPLLLRRVSIKRLLVNLIENALRYGGGKVEVSAQVHSERGSPYVVLSVLDRGNGIDPQEIHTLFNPFIRGDRARGGQGTGLGLAIVKRIAAQHGGSIELRNRPEGGLEARVCLPLGLLLPKDAA